MAVTPTAMVRTTLSGSSSTLYTVPALTTAVVTNILLANTTAAAVAVTINLDGIAVLSGYSVPANGNLAFDLRQVLGTTKTITGFAATAAAVTCHVSGTENT